MRGKFRDDYKADGAWAPVAEALNKIGRCLNNMVGVQGVRLDWNAGRGSFDFYGEPNAENAAETLPWAVTIATAGSSVTVTCSGGIARSWIDGSKVTEQTLAPPVTDWSYSDGAHVYLKYQHRCAEESLLPVFTLAYGTLPANTYDAMYVPLALTATVDSVPTVTRLAWSTVDVTDAFRKQVKLWEGNIGHVPEFYEVVSEFYNRFPVGAGDEYSAGATGGYAKHCKSGGGADANAHADVDISHTHDMATQGALAYGYDANVGAMTGSALVSNTITLSETDNRPPYLAVYFIRRK